MNYPKPKPWYHSRMIWLNIVAAAGQAIAATQDAPMWVVQLGAVVQAGANVLLRFDTSQPIKKAN